VCPGRPAEPLRHRTPRASPIVEGQAVSDNPPSPRVQALAASALRLTAAIRSSFPIEGEWWEGVGASQAEGSNAGCGGAYSDSPLRRRLSTRRGVTDARLATSRVANAAAAQQNRRANRRDRCRPYQRVRIGSARRRLRVPSIIESSARPGCALLYLLSGLWVESGQGQAPVRSGWHPGRCGRCRSRRHTCTG
jgi:hypothetical protein